MTLFFLFVTTLAIGYSEPVHTAESGSAGPLTPTTGILVGSFARNPAGTQYTREEFDFRNVQTNQVWKIRSQQVSTLRADKTPDEFATTDSVGSLFTFTLPAGRYVLFSCAVDQSGTFSFPKKDFAIPFDVQPNATNYIGEIKLDPEFREVGLFHNRIQERGWWIISDKSSRDLEILKRVHSEIPLSNLLNAVPDRKEVFTPNVVLPSEMEAYRKMRESLK